MLVVLIAPYVKLVWLQAVTQRGTYSGSIPLRLLIEPSVVDVHLLIRPRQRNIQMSSQCAGGGKSLAFFAMVYMRLVQRQTTTTAVCVIVL